MHFGDVCTMEVSQPREQGDGTLYKGGNRRAYTWGGGLVGWLDVSTSFLPGRESRECCKGCGLSDR